VSFFTNKRVHYALAI